ncbi:hypothetical protein, partial [Treponema endosymbiont of Eucomonympha sp.]|uniref:hypothetical protein n=1 Tax=Treponema endosymbiont of Eucomonympha sp. TaxID=1580831 RepID=UPI000A4A9D45
AVRAETVSLASALLFEAKDSPALTQSASLFARYERCVFFAFVSVLKWNNHSPISFPRVD